MTSSLQETYYSFDRSLEQLGFEPEMQQGYCVRVIDFTNREQMIRAGELAPTSFYQLFVLAVAWTCKHLSSSKYEWAEKELVKIGITTVGRLCLSSYPNVYSQKLPTLIWFACPVQYSSEFTPYRGL